RGTDVDGDVNDHNAPYTPNDGPDQAQPIANPITVGGYVNQPGAGEDGALQAQGDVSDFYRASVAEGQPISLQIADPGQGDPDLYLWDTAGNILATSVNTGTSELVIAPAAGE